MSTSSPQPSSEPVGTIPNRRLDVYIAVVVAMTIVVVGTLSAVQSQMTMRPVNWVIFGLFAVLLFVSETLTSSLWLRFGNGGVVTLSWTFAFSLLLLGNPTLAVVIMALSTLTAEITGRTGLRKIIFNTAQVALALGAGGLVLIAFGVDGPITREGTIPTSWGVGLLASGTAVFLLNGVVLGYLLAMVERTSFIRMMRDGFAKSMMVDGTLLALAPIVVITTGYSLVVGPLLAIAGIMVYQTARESMRREHLANHDTLTSLRNRRSFGEEIERFLEDRVELDTTGVLLLLDLDGFKAVNDNLGHHVGDDLLRAFSDRLLESLPPSAVVARLGGDEFAVLMRDVDGAKGVESIKQLHERLTTPLIIEDHPLAVGVSIGISMCPDHGTQASDLLRAADVAMYRAKERRSGFEVFDERTGPARSVSSSLLGELEEAMSRGQLTLVFQPQIRLLDHSVDSVEALVSWEPSSFRTMHSDEIFALAAHTELMGPFTDFVIESAIRSIQAVKHERLSVTVKVSPYNFLDEGFADRTLSLLDRWGLAPWRLELAVDEGALVGIPDRIGEQIQQIRRAGVRIALDGFGAGRSSMLTIRELFVDRIKIGAPFVENVSTPGPDRVIARSLVELAHGLGSEIVGVGIDDQLTWDALAELGYDVLQGPLVSDPMDTDELAQWLLKRRSTQLMELTR